VFLPQRSACRRVQRGLQDAHGLCRIGAFAVVASDAGRVRQRRLRPPPYSRCRSRGRCDLR
jgi:hypothetical protein